MIPSTTIDKTDGNLGVTSDTAKILAIIACASAGPFDTPTPLSDKNDLLAAFTSGALVEFGAYMIEQGVPIVAIRSNPTTAGAYGSVDSSGKTGSSAVTAGSTAPDYDYDVIVQIVTGGTKGADGIVFIYSLDNGENWSDNQSLGTATTMTLERGVSFALGTGTLVAGDTWTVTTTGPKNLTADIADSCTALAAYSGEWLRVLPSADADATINAQIHTFVSSFHDDGMYPEGITNTRPRGSAESAATYQTALATIASGAQSTEVSCCADQCEVVSAVDGRRLRMPVSVVVAARLMTIDDSVDAAEKALGALPGVFLTTRDGVRAYYDARFDKPGNLDNLGFTTLRTWGGRPATPGAYICNARLLSGAGSDFRYFQHTALLNRAIEMAFQLTNNKLSKGILCDTTTGKIREDVAKGFDEDTTATLRTSFTDPARCSGIQFKLSRTDDVLNTDTIHFDVKLVPLAYPKKFIGKAGLAKTLS